MENSKKSFRTKLSSCAEYFFHNTPKVSLVFFALAILAFVIRIVCRSSQSFSDFFVRYIAGPVRFVLAKISSVIPISLAEILIWLLPFVIALVIFLAVRYSREKRSAFRYIMTLLSIAALVYFLFVFTLASGYHTSTVARDFDIERKDVTALELKQTAEWLVENANKYSAEFANQGNKASEMPFSWSGLNDNLNASYKKLNAEYDFIFNFSTRTKPVLISSLMSYTGILGVYSFFTGEANVNTAYPDYTTVFTAAHEMAHQRGIAREDEANFVAFMVCIKSDNAYLNYCGYVNAYEYVMNALKNENADYYAEVKSKCDANVKKEMGAYAETYYKYDDNPVSDVTDTINNTYLEIQGTEGTKSYGMVVDLAVAYYKSISER